MEHISRINADLPLHTKTAQKAHKLKSKLLFEREWMDKAADFLTRQFGTLWFLILNAILFVGWIEWNLGWFGFEPFDPFPFGLLTMIVSLEAIFLSVVVLISQNRQSKVADIRQQIDFEIEVRAEEEITKILRMLDTLQQHFGIAHRDRELRQMERHTNIREIQREIENGELQ